MKEKKKVNYNSANLKIQERLQRLNKTIVKNSLRSVNKQKKKGLDNEEGS